jgi:hypothetical protein
VNGLQSLRRPEEVARIRGKAVEDILFPPKKKRDEPAEEPAAAAEPAAEAAEQPRTETETETDGEASDHAGS